MEIYVKIYFISLLYLFFWLSSMILSDVLILPVSQLLLYPSVFFVSTSTISHFC